MHARESIQYRVRRSLFQNTAVAVVAFLNVATAIVFLLIEGVDELTIMFVVGVFFKEVIFITILLYKTAEVNEAFVLFLKSCNQNLLSDSEDILVTNDVENNMKWQSGQLKMARIILNLQSEPLYFPLVGHNWTKVDVIKQCLLVVIGILGAVVKTFLFVEYA